MKDYIRLVFFNVFIGGHSGFQFIRQQLGVKRALTVVAKMQLRLLMDNPFNEMNASRSKISWKERSSQKQIAPIFCLYDALIETGYSEEEALACIETVVMGVASKFLAFSIPRIRYRDIVMIERDKRLAVFSRLVSRFPNASGALKFDGGREYRFTVDKCLFAVYCNALGYKKLSPIFCQADQHYFDKHQPDIEFSRIDTLATNKKPCDFSFAIIESNIIARG